MASSATVIRMADLRPRQASALKQKAERLGVSPTTYIKQLIEEDLELDRKARNSSLEELSAPFRTALKDVPEDELDRRVEIAKSKYRRQTSKRKF